MERLKEDKQVFVDGCGTRIFKFIGIDVSNGKAILKDGGIIRSEDVKNIIPVYPGCGDYCQLYVKLQDAVKKTKNLSYRQVLRLLSELAVKYDLSEVKMASLLTHAIGYIKKCKTTNIIDLEKFINNCDVFAYLQSDLKRKQEDGCRVGRFLSLEEVRVLGYGNTRFWIKGYVNGKYTVFDKSNTSMGVNESNIRPILAEDSGKATLMEAAVSMVPSREEIYGVKEEQKNEECAVVNSKDPKVREMKAKAVLQELISEYGIKGVNLSEVECVYSKTFNFDEEQNVLFLERIVDRLQNSSNRDEMDATRLSYVFLLSAGDIIEWSAKRDIAELDKDRRAAKTGEADQKLKIWENPECIDVTGNKYLNKQSISSKTTFKEHYMVGDFICDAVEHDGFTKKYVVTSVAEDRIEAEEVKKGIIFGFSPDDEFTRFTKMADKRKFVKRVDTVNRKKWKDPQCVCLPSQEEMTKDKVVPSNSVTLGVARVDEILDGKNPLV